MPGDEYKYLKKTIAIWILNFNFFKTNTYHNIAHMRFDKIKKEEYVDMGYKEENGLVTENAEIHFIELPKFIEKNPGIKRKLDQWLWLLAGKEDEIKMAEKVNEEVKKAKTELEVMSMNPKEREEYEERELARWSYYSEIEAAKRVGKEEGIQIGKVDGKNENKKEIAKKMKEEGFEISTIEKITGLTIEDIKEL